jgi:hypothetical protein
LLGVLVAPRIQARYGIDIRSKDFWQASLGVLIADIYRFEALVADR